MEQSIVEGWKIVVRDHDQSPLIKASFHRMIKFLAEDTRSIKGVSTAMRGIWRAELYIWRVVRDGKIESEILGSFRVLLLRKAISI
jgi:hypothetical protein